MVFIEHNLAIILNNILSIEDIMSENANQSKK